MTYLLEIDLSIRNWEILQIMAGTGKLRLGQNRTKRFFTNPLTLLAASVIVAVIVVIYFTHTHNEQTREQIIASKTNEIKILASRTELRLQDAGNVIQITSQLPQLQSEPRVNLIDKSLFGIPESIDVLKRQVAKDVIRNYRGFEYLFFLLPNGDLYFLEPYSQQLNLTRNNFAFRDYYKGAFDTKGTYLSETYVSNNNGHNVAAIATLVYDNTTDMSSNIANNNDQVIGLWVGALDLNVMNDALRILNPGKHGNFIFVDQHGKIVAGSDYMVQSGILPKELITNLEGFKEAVYNGKVGYTVEQINGVKNFITYSPIKALSNEWVVLSVQPYDDAFAPIVSAQNQMILMVTLIVSVAVVFGVLLQRTFGSLERTTVTLKHSNEQLIGKENELQEANKVLLQTERQKEEFISMISHELRTPLVPIKGYAEMLLKGIMGELNTNQLKAILSIVRNVEKQEALVEDVLDVYKLDMGKIHLLKKPIPIKDVVTDIINDLNSLTKEKQVQLLSQIETSDPDPMIVADRKRIDQVIANLIKNSIDFVPKETGKIVLKIEEQTEKDPGTETATVYVFSVEDNGIGIPVDKMDSLFNKFYQVDTTATRKHGGTGLGLAISRGLVEAHGGIIWIDKDLKNGTRIKFTIPAGASTMKRELLNPQQDANVSSVTRSVSL